MTIDYVQGSLIPKDDLTLPYIWVSLHLNAQMEQETLANPRLSRETVRMENEISYLLEALKKVAMQKWWGLCDASGWTVYGAIALSWCQDAEISQVWDGWEASGFLLKPLPENERPAHFINPALLPQTSSLSEIVNFCPDKSLPICATIAALKSPLEFDLPAENLKAATPQLASFLKSRMQQKTGRTAEEDKMIQVWSERERNQVGKRKRGPR